MVARILTWLVVGMVLTFAAFWLLTGGIQKIKDAAGSMGSPLSLLTATSTRITLPGAPTMPRGIDISPLLEGGTSAPESTGTGSIQDFGNPSPWSGQVSLALLGARTGNPQTDYIVIDARSANSSVDITAWTLQSAITGAQAAIPRGAELFTQGVLNAQTDIVLTPGSIAVVLPGYSPVGTSFRMNECSGYLGEMQRFSPPLSASCPAPSLESWNARSYGSACADYVNSLPACTTPLSVPQSVGSACSMYVQDVFSYNGCVREHQSDGGFYGKEWRIYLGSSHTPWRDGDVVRLLDAQGRTVSTISF